MNLTVEEELLLLNNLLSCLLHYYVFKLFNNYRNYIYNDRSF